MKTSPQRDESSDEVRIPLAHAKIRSCLVDSERFQLTLTNNLSLDFHPRDPEVLRYLNTVEHDPDGGFPDDFLDRMERFLHEGKLGVPQLVDFANSERTSRSS